MRVSDAVTNNPKTQRLKTCKFSSHSQCMRNGKRGSDLLSENKVDGEAISRAMLISREERERVRVNDAPPHLTSRKYI